MYLSYSWDAEEFVFVQYVSPVFGSLHSVLFVVPVLPVEAVQERTLGKLTTNLATFNVRVFFMYFCYAFLELSSFCIQGLEM